ncbi:MAG: diguanylate cyclase [Pseudomonadota bacterium]
MWFGALMLVQVWRLAVAQSLARGPANGDTQRRPELQLTIVSAASGFVWGLLPSVEPPLAVGPAQLVVPAALLGVAAGSTVALASHLPALYAFLGGVAVPFAFQSFVRGDLLGPVLAVFAFIYACCLVALGRQMNRIQRRTVDLLTGNQRLVTALQRARSDLERRVADRTQALEERNQILAEEVRRRQTRERELAELVNRDALTGLPNRTAFIDRLQVAISRAARAKTRVAVVMIDVDHFKRVNDTHGHPAGDAVLRELARRLTSVTRASDTVARYAGDEFIGVFPDLEEVTDAAAVVTKLVDRCLGPVELETAAVDVRISVGYAIWPDDGGSIDELVAAADVALYHAKVRGRGRAERVAPDLVAAFAGRLTPNDAVRGQLDRGTLAVRFQPRRDLLSGRIAGLQTILVGDGVAKGGLVAETIAHGGDVRLLQRLDDLVLAGACRLAARAPAGTTVALPLSSASVVEGGIAADAAERLNTGRFPTDRLLVELPEHMHVAASSDMWVGGRLAGMALGLYGVGGGLMSFRELQALPLASMRFHRDVVRPFGDGNRGSAALTALAAWARQAGVTGVADGIDDDCAWDAATAAGCDQVQGAALGPAFDEDQALSLLTEAAAS